MTLGFASIDTTTLDTVETSIGTSPTLTLYSGTSTGLCANPDPVGALVVLTLPSDWMAAQSGNSKAKLGTWSGTVFADGIASAFRLKGSGGTVHMDGSVGVNLGDLPFLHTTSLKIGQVVRVTAFTLSFASVAQQVQAILVKTQANNTLVGAATVINPSAANDTWTKISTDFVIPDPRAGPDGLSQGWWRAAMIGTTGEILIAQGNPSFGNRGTYIFRPSLGYFTRTNSDTSLFWKNMTMGAFAENYDLVFDPDTNSLWRSEGGPYGEDYFATTSTHIGELRYDIATDEWFTTYPAVGTTYSPSTAPEIAHYNVAGRGNTMAGFSSCWVYLNGYIYQFGSFSIGGAQNLKRRNIASGAVTTLLDYSVGPSWTTAAGSRDPVFRSGMGGRTRVAWTLGDQGQLWTCPLNVHAPLLRWRQITTTGDKPIIPVPPQYASDPVRNWLTDWAIHATYHDEGDQIIVWVSSNDADGSGGISIRKTWILDMTTLVWRSGPSAGQGNDVPPLQAMTGQALRYNPVTETANLLIWNQPAQRSEVWEFAPEYTGQGTITSHPLPATSGTLPFTLSRANKHTNMAYCPLDNRIYVSGGDIGVSAVDGVWSMDVANGAWQQEAGAPVFPTFPAPLSAQDGMGFAWSAARNRLLFWPGSYFNNGGGAEAVYKYGLWMFNPVNKVWTQHTEFWDTYGESTGNLYGGAYNPADDTIYVVSEDGGAVRRYRISDMTQLADVNIGYSWYGANGTFSTRGMQVVCNGAIYFPAFFTPDGINGYAAMGRFDLTTQVATRCSPPPLSAGIGLDTKEWRLGVSGTRLVWPYTNGPDGTILNGVLIYHTAQDVWGIDWQNPATGNQFWGGNTVCSLPDGRVAFCGGGTGGPNPTNFWFYTPAS